MTQIAAPAPRVAGVSGRILDILEVVGLDGRGLSLAEVASGAGLPKSSALRLLRVLEQRGFLERSAFEKYRVSESILIIAHQVLASSQMKAFATPFLVSLCTKFGRIANLAIPIWPRVIYLDHVSPPELHAIVSPPGKVIPFYATAAGKAIVAFQSKELIDHLLGHPRVAYTERTIADGSALRHELETVKSRGWAGDNGEFRLDITCVAAPVRDRDGRVIASISLSSIGDSVTDEDHAQAVVGAANNLSGIHGYSQ